MNGLESPRYPGGTRREEMAAIARAVGVEEYFKPEYCENELQRNPDEFGADAVNNGLDKAMDAAGVKEGAWLRGIVLHEAMQVINGARQDVYGAPEDSFRLIARYWQTYLESRPGLMTFMGAKPDHAEPLGPEDVAMMMTLFKIAREANQHKRDNIVDAGGYLGIYADMMEGE